MNAVHFAPIGLLALAVPVQAGAASYIASYTTNVSTTGFIDGSTQITAKETMNLTFDLADAPDSDGFSRILSFSGTRDFFSLPTGTTRFGLTLLPSDDARINLSEPTLFSRDGLHFRAANGVNYNVYAINGRVVELAGGAGTLITDLTIRPAAAAVPEPASWAVMIAGMGLVGGALRRRRCEPRAARRPLAVA